MKNSIRQKSAQIFCAAFLAVFLISASEARSQGRGPWEGFHIGGLIGGTDVDYGVGQTGLAAPITTLSDDADGTVGGFLYGTTWRSGNFVFGTDSDYSWSDAETGTTTAAGGLTAKADIEWSSGTRIRGGVLVSPNMLAYGAIGLAFANVEISGTLMPGGDDDETLFGFQVGGGLEAMFDRWFFRGEYLYTTYDDEKFRAVGGGTFNVDLDSHIYRVAVGYRFDWSPWDLLTK